MNLSITGFFRLGSERDCCSSCAEMMNDRVVCVWGSEEQGLNPSEDVFGLDHCADRSVADFALRYVLFY